MSCEFLKYNDVSFNYYKDAPCAANVIFHQSLRPTSSIKKKVVLQWHTSFVKLQNEGACTTAHLKN